MRPQLPSSHWKYKLYVIIFEHDTPKGKQFDEILIGCIVASVFAVMIASVPTVAEAWNRPLYILEWIFTILFTIEYIVRLMCHGKPIRYAGSFFGIVDVLAILPTYLDLIIPGTHVLLVIRILRVLRVFRILKLIQFVGEADQLLQALKASVNKITVFLMAVLSLVVILGSFMYVIEGESNGFTSIPVGIYWAIVTMTTVGYGDISPATPAGRMLASVVMILGYAIIAVPTGIVTVEIGQAKKGVRRSCPRCGADDLPNKSRFCHHCGESLVTQGA